MNLSDASDSFRIARLRFLRPPPSSIFIPDDTSAQRPATIPIELALGITDDYGVHLDSFESLDVRIRVVESLDKGNTPIKGIELTVGGTTPPSDELTIKTSRGSFHKVKIMLKLFLSAVSAPKSIRFELSVRSPSEREVPSKLSIASQRVLETICETVQEPLEAWDGNRYVFMSALSGDVGIERAKETGPTLTKVQNIMRRIRVSGRTPNTGSAPPTEIDLSNSTSIDADVINIVERPGLNNSTGQRLWDCAIGLSAYLSLDPRALLPRHPLGASDPMSGPGPTKRSRPTPRRLVVLELGAGCALVSMCTRRLIERLEELGDLPKGSGANGPINRVISTDVEETVSTTLRENLDFNECFCTIESKVLQWGPLSSESIEALIGPGGGQDDLEQTSSTDVTLLGTDVLYNPESHEVLLDTLRSFLDGTPGRRALITYKPRTEGDHRFFELASRPRNSEPKLKVERVWMWGEIQVWSIECGEARSTRRIERLF